MWPLETSGNIWKHLPRSWANLLQWNETDSLRSTGVRKYEIRFLSDQILMWWTSMFLQTCRRCCCPRLHLLLMLSVWNTFMLQETETADCSEQQRFSRSDLDSLIATAFRSPHSPHVSNDLAEVHVSQSYPRPVQLSDSKYRAAGFLQEQNSSHSAEEKPSSESVSLQQEKRRMLRMMVEQNKNMNSCQRLKTSRSLSVQIDLLSLEMTRSDQRNTNVSIKFCCLVIKDNKLTYKHF